MQTRSKYPTQINGSDLFLAFINPVKRFERISSIDYNERGAWIRTNHDTASHYFENTEKVLVAS